MPPKLKGLYLLLALSLIGNIFAAGVWIGKEMRPDRRSGAHDGAGGPPEMMSMRRLAIYLPDDKKAEMRELVEGHRDGLRDTFRTMRRAEKQVRAILEAEIVDKEALAAALDQIDNSARNLHGPLRTIMLDIVADLDLETRRKLAEDLYQRRKFRVDGRRDGDFGPGFGRRPPPRREGGFGGPDGHSDGPPPPRPEDDRQDRNGPDEQYPEDGPAENKPQP